MTMERQCKGCEATIDVTRKLGQRGRNRLFCTEQCTRRHHNSLIRDKIRSKPKLPKPQRFDVIECAVCHEFDIRPLWRSGGHGSQPRQFCSDACKRLAAAMVATPRFWSECQTCRQMAELTQGQKHCPKCRSARRYESACYCCDAVVVRSAMTRKKPCCEDCYRGGVALTKEFWVADRPYECRGCSREFDPKQPQQEWCSEGCRNRFHTHAKRVRHRKAMVDEDISIGGVYERSNGVCGICCGEVDLSIPCPHPMSASIDHVIPLAKGGLHKWGNVQLAHFGCNSRKRDRLGEEAA